MSCETCCKNCKFFEARNKFCRRNPPQPVVISKRDGRDREVVDLVVSKYPVVVFPDTDWCGEFEPEDNLLEE